MSEDRVHLERTQRESERRGPDTDVDMQISIDQRAKAAWVFYMALQKNGFHQEEALHLVAALGI